MALAQTIAQTAAPRQETVASDVPTLTPGARWQLLSQVIHVQVNLHRSGSLRGTVLLRVRLPRSRAGLGAIRLNCAPTCVVHRCLVDGAPLTQATETGEHAPSARPPMAADGIAETVVPPQWRHTRDIVSYQRCHGAATFVGSFQHWEEGEGSHGFHAGELRIPLPSSSVGEVDAPVSSGSAAGGGSTEWEEMEISVEYSVPRPNGGIHFVRRHPHAECPAARAGGVRLHVKDLAL